MHDGSSPFPDWLISAERFDCNVGAGSGGGARKPPPGWDGTPGPNSPPDESSQISDLQAQIADLQTKENADQTEIAGLQTNEKDDQTQIADLQTKEKADQTQIAGLKSKEKDDQSNEQADQANEQADRKEIAAVEGQQEYTYSPFQKPDPQAQVGLNSQVTYGENISTTVGWSHQLCLGSNTQIFINPLEALAILPGSWKFPAELGMLCGGAGANLQLIMGSNTNFTLGRNYTVNLGPDEVKFDFGAEIKDLPADQEERDCLLKNVNSAKLFTKVMAFVVMALIITWVISYAEVTDEDKRAEIALAFQVALSALLAVMMAVYTDIDTANRLLKGEQNVLFRMNTDTGRVFAPVVTRVSTVGPALLELAIMEPVVNAQDEAHFDNEDQESQRKQAETYAQS